MWLLLLFFQGVLSLDTLFMQMPPLIFDSAFIDQTHSTWRSLDQYSYDIQPMTMFPLSKC